MKFVCMECTEGWDTCFCTTMGTNETDNYSLAVRFLEDGLLLNVNDKEFENYFKGEEETEFNLEFIKENKAEVNLPNI